MEHRYFLAFRLHHGKEIVVAFPKTLPRLDKLRPVYQDIFHRFIEGRVEKNTWDKAHTHMDQTEPKLESNTIM
jgi:hypothetical protein